MQEKLDLLVESLTNICKKYEARANNSHILQLIYYHYTFVVGIKKNYPCFFKHRLVWHVLLTTYCNIVYKCILVLGGYKIFLISSSFDYLPICYPQILIIIIICKIFNYNIL